MKSTTRNGSLTENKNGQKIKRDRTLRIRGEAWRPGKKFSEWIRAHKIAAVAEQIGVERITIYKWLNGERPPHPDSATNLVSLSKLYPEEIGALTLDDIYGKHAPS
jgi:transcriptional regulator with XRE-family HTH domain